MTMIEQNGLNLHPPEFERFLFASVGEDRNGYGVAVISALARLGLDPWKETAELVTPGRDAARARLGAMLARFRGVPTHASDFGRVARDPSQLLPEAPTSGTQQRAASTVDDGRLAESGAIRAVLALIFALSQMFLVGGSGQGE